MPIISFKSKIQTTSGSCSLILLARHRLQVGESDVVYDVKSAPPDGIDVLSASRLVITLSGILDGQEIRPEDLMESRIAYRLADYLSLNGEELGIHTVSDAHISDDTDLFTFIYSSSRQVPNYEWSRIQAVRLLGFDIHYIWKTTISDAVEHDHHTHLMSALNPFSKRLSLSYSTMLDSVLERFIKYQVVKRYPLIFGSWSKQLDIEHGFFPSIYDSLSHIIYRSPHLGFKKRCRKLLKLCSQEYNASLQSHALKISRYLSAIDDKTLHLKIPTTTDKDAFLATMKAFYVVGLKRPLFKSSTTVCVFEDKEAHTLVEVTADHQNLDFSASKSVGIFDLQIDDVDFTHKLSCHGSDDSVVSENSELTPRLSDFEDISSIVNGHPRRVSIECDGTSFHEIEANKYDIRMTIHSSPSSVLHPLTSGKSSHTISVDDVFPDSAGPLSKEVSMPRHLGRWSDDLGMASEGTYQQVHAEKEFNEERSEISPEKSLSIAFRAMANAFHDDHCLYSFPFALDENGPEPSDMIACFKPVLDHEDLESRSPEKQVYVNEIVDQEMIPFDSLEDLQCAFLPIDFN